MGYINILATLIYSVLGWLVLFQHKRLGLDDIGFLKFLIFAPLIYLAFQLWGIAAREISDIKAHIFDWITSLIPLIIFLKSQSQSSWDFKLFENTYLFATLIDICFITYLSFVYVRSQTYIK